MDRAERECTTTNDALNMKNQEVLQFQEALRSAESMVHEYQQKDVDVSTLLYDVTLLGMLDHS